jgi:hypothetical protein
VLTLAGMIEDLCTTMFIKIYNNESRTKPENIMNTSNIPE